MTECDPAALPEIIVREYADLVDGLRSYVNAHGITFETLEGEAKLTSGFAGKLLSVRFVKILGPKTLGKMLAALGAELVLRPRPSTGAPKKALPKRKRPPVHWHTRQGVEQ